MAKTSIKPEEAKSVASTALATQEAKPAAAPANYCPDQYDDPSRDVQLPVLGLINKIGPLSKTFPKNAGEFAFGSDGVDILLGEKVTVIPVAFAKFFIESRRDGKDLKFGDGILPKTFATANEAYAAGYVIDFDSNCPNRIEEASKVAFLVLGPTNDTSGEFYLRAPDGSAKYALGISTYRRGSHRGVYRPLYNHYYRRAKVEGVALEQLSELVAKPDFIWTIEAEYVEDVKKSQDWFETRIKKQAPIDPGLTAWIAAEVGKLAI